jgi:hypothetical protein
MKNNEKDSARKKSRQYDITFEFAMLPYFCLTIFLLFPVYPIFGIGIKSRNLRESSVIRLKILKTSLKIAFTRLGLV